MKPAAALIASVAWVALASLSMGLFGRVIGVASPWFSVALVFCILSFAALARALIAFKVPRWLRPIRSWEARGAVYRALRVPLFGSFLRNTPLRRLQPRVYLGRHRWDPTTVKSEIEGAEGAHFWAAILPLPWMIHACIRNGWSAVLLLAAFQIAMNLYPILHLRSARSRLDLAVAGRRNRPGQRAALRSIDGAQ
jgi:Glycosyl-4,4'-diaponeurosporenoate acyltransferase